MVENLVDVLKKYNTSLSVETARSKRIKIVLTKDGTKYTRVFSREDLKIPLDEEIAYFVKEVNGDANSETDILSLLQMYNLSITIRQNNRDEILLRIFDVNRSYRYVIDKSVIDTSVEEAVLKCVKYTIERIRKETECV